MTLSAWQRHKLGPSSQGRRITGVLENTYDLLANVAAQVNGWRFITEMKTTRTTILLTTKLFVQNATRRNTARKEEGFYRVVGMSKRCSFRMLGLRAAKPCAISLRQVRCRTYESVLSQSYTGRGNYSGVAE